MRKIAVIGNETIHIGRRGENQAIQIVWTNILENWRTMYGEGVVQLAVRRPKDTAPYPVACEVSGNDVMWTIQAADTAQSGVGECELSYIVDAVLVKSQTWNTMIARSLTGAGTVEPPSEPAKTWFTKIQTEIGNLEDLETGDKSNLVAAINEVAQSVGGSTSDHTKLKNRDADNQHPMSAITGLTDALAGKQPTGNYLTRDDLQDATDKALAQAKASGEFDGADGAPGPQGPIGPAGPQGPKGEPGKDGGIAITNTATVGQIAKITAVDDSGKPTAWEAVDMPSGGGSVPKPLTYDYMPEGYPTKSVQTTTLMEEQQVAFSLTGNGAYVVRIPSGFTIVKGQTYTVNWDGAEYECVGSAFNSMPVLGNLSIAGGGDDTGEPFFYVYNISQSLGQFATLDTSASHTISVKTAVEVITPMAEEFLPATALITYDLDTNTYSADLTNDELRARLLDGKQIVLYTTDGNEYLYLTKWTKATSGRIDLAFAGDAYSVSLNTDGTIGKTPLS